MNHKIKKWFIAAALLIIIGLLILVIAVAMFGWGFSKLGTEKYVSNTYYINDSFEDISIITDTADIAFLPSEDGKCVVECYEEENIKHAVGVSDGTLTVDVHDERKWYEYIDISFDSPKISIYLPENEYASLFINESTGEIIIPENFKFENIDISLSTGDVKNYACASDLIKIKASTGDILLENITAGALDLSVSTGEIEVKNAECNWNIEIGVSTGKTFLSGVSCMNLITDGSTGDISLSDVLAEGFFSIERGTGDVSFDACDAAAIWVKTDTGDVKGTLLSDKIFLVESDTGRIDVPKSVTGGKCEITTDTGNIKITVEQAS